jgi:hypothetical protein
LHVILVICEFEYATAVLNSIVSNDANKLEGVRQKMLLIILNRFLQYIRYSVTDLINALRGNGSVNRFQHATMEAVSQWANVIARC